MQTVMPQDQTANAKFRVFTSSSSERGGRHGFTYTGKVVKVQLFDCESLRSRISVAVPMVAPSLLGLREQIMRGYRRWNKARLALCPKELILGHAIRPKVPKRGWHAKELAI